MRKEVITLTVNMLLPAGNTDTLQSSIGLISSNYSQVACPLPYVILHWQWWKVFKSHAGVVIPLHVLPNWHRVLSEWSHWEWRYHVLMTSTSIHNTCLPLALTVNCLFVPPIITHGVMWSISQTLHLPFWYCYLLLFKMHCFLKYIQRKDILLVKLNYYYFNWI